MAGLAVDAVEAWGRYPGIVAGALVGLEPHPNAERLKLCRVNAGSRGTFRAVSGAPGLEAGERVALALPGATLAVGGRVEAVEIRGVVSEAAVVSEREIGLSEEGSTVMRLPRSAEPGADLCEVLGTADTILDVDVSPNRGDCLSILGMARELTAITGLRRKKPSIRLSEAGPPAEEQIRVEIAAPDLCWRYVARVVTGAAVGPSPLWLRNRLEAMGVRSINSVVDVTNYVMLERGQPLHAFDLERLSGRTIVVRRAGETRRLATLDGMERELDAEDLVIADRERPVAIAGVMGGADSAVGPETRTILIEAAFFVPATVRRTSRRLGLRSESSLRFERTVDVEGVAVGSDRAAELLARLARAGVASGRVDVYPRPWQPAEIVVRSDRVNRLLGTSLSVAEVGQTLRRVSASVKAAGRGGYVCQPPSHRADLGREADLVEEVARLRGYGAIPERLPAAPIQVVCNPRDWSLARDAREVLLGQGLTEMINLRFVAAEWNRRLPGLAPPESRPVRLVNPLSAEAEEMRKSLLPGLLLAAERNRRQGEGWIRAFEIGRVFWSEDGATRERLALGGLLWGSLRPDGPLREERRESFFDAKGVLEALFDSLRAGPVRWLREPIPEFLHPGKSASIRVGEGLVGTVGGLHPELARRTGLEGDVFAFELDLEAVGSDASPPIAFRPLAKYPSVVRDLAVIAEESFEAQAVPDMIAARPDLLVEEVHLFDVYRGSPIPAGRKSLAYSIAYRAPDRTLTDDEVNGLHRRLTGALRERFGLELRG